MAARAKRSKKYLVWVDCEMTGLDPEKDVLLEIATIITDYDLDIIAVGPELAIRQSEARLKGMDAWNRRTHAKSGLLDRVRNEGVSTREAERETLAFVKKYCYAGSAPLCGNSVGHDKRFLAKHMPQFLRFLHYRIIDVSSIKVLVREWYGDKFKPPEKPEVHRAMADIEQSIDELRHYREKVFVER
ncbi:MAG TPA: oligoribonuclease [Thermoanaerobaculia bacterium]|jgi:oligoribonuclease|nr:oligoribonuclease [Thermoanaerobaculia bacterium]